MEFDFFHEWESVKTVKVGGKLMKKLVTLQSINNMTVVDSTFPTGHPDDGVDIQRYWFANSRYLFAQELSGVLSDECQKMVDNEGESNSPTNTRNNPQVLVELLTSVLDTRTTHFTLG